MVLKSYKLLCPIARALDVVGDRWTLLILRDLHAGPARFTDLLSGLQGIASNLLTSRLNGLIENNLVLQNQVEFGVTVYELTEHGEKTNKILFELMMLGGTLPRPEITIKPGNLRTIAVTLKSVLEKVAPQDLTLVACLVVDDESFSIRCDQGACNVRYRTCSNPDVTLKTSYIPLMDFFEGALSFDEFANQHCIIDTQDPEKANALAGLFQAVIAVRALTH